MKGRSGAGLDGVAVPALARCVRPGVWGVSLSTVSVSRIFLGLVSHRLVTSAPRMRGMGSTGTSLLDERGSLMGDQVREVGWLMPPRGGQRGIARRRTSS